MAKKNLPETRQHSNILFDFYEALLTARQREIFTMHYMEDCSLAEIAQTMEITPQAVSDILKRTSKRLAHYESLLGLIKKHEHRKQTANQIIMALGNLDDPLAAKVIKMMDYLI